jgi:hypothetical protein
VPGASAAEILRILKILRPPFFVTGWILPFIREERKNGNERPAEDLKDLEDGGARRLVINPLRSAASAIFPIRSLFRIFALHFPSIKFVNYRQACSPRVREWQSRRKPNRDGSPKRGSILSAPRSAGRKRIRETFYGWISGQVAHLQRVRRGVYLHRHGAGISPAEGVRERAPAVRAVP